jgi:hypothetical protein
MPLCEVRIHIPTPSVVKQSTVTKFADPNANFGIIHPAGLLPSNGHNINKESAGLNFHLTVNTYIIKVPTLLSPV